jgi:hypothetical protein
MKLVPARPSEEDLREEANRLDAYIQQKKVTLPITPAGYQA